MEEQKSVVRTTRIFWENKNSTHKIHLNRGGTRSSKTYSIVQLAVLWLNGADGKGENETWSICRATLPSLRATAYRDFIEIMQKQELYFNHNKSIMEFTKYNRTVEFFSLDDEQKIRSRKRTHLHIVEANEINYTTFIQLLIRTKGKVFCDWNPSDPHHWLREDIEIKRAQVKKDVKVIVSTYVDNPYLSADEIREIEYLKEVDKELWAVFGAGEYGSFTDTIFKSYETTSYPKDCDYEYIGLDFGFSIDPAAVILVGKSGSHLYLKELIFKRGLTNKALADAIGETGFDNKEIVADSAEPKSIAELNGYGLRVYGATKGTDSIKAGIMKMREFTIHIDPASINLLKEFRSYKWSDKKAGVPVDAFNHGIDAVRYVVWKFFRGSQRMTSSMPVMTTSTRDDF